MQISERAIAEPIFIGHPQHAPLVSEAGTVSQVSLFDLMKSGIRIKGSRQIVIKFYRRQRFPDSKIEVVRWNRKILNQHRQTKRRKKKRELQCKSLQFLSLVYL